MCHLVFGYFLSAAVIDAYPHRNFLDGIGYFEDIGPNDFFVAQNYAELEDAVHLFYGCNLRQPACMQNGIDYSQEKVG